MVRFLKDYDGWMTSHVAYSRGDLAQLNERTVQLLARYGYVEQAIEQPAILPYPVPDVEDDLTIITGIGAKMAEALNQLGVWTYVDLAQADPNWLDEQVARSAEQIEVWQMEAQGHI